MCIQDYLLARLAYTTQTRCIAPLAAKAEILKTNDNRVTVVIPSLPNAVDFTITNSNDLTVAGFRIAAGLEPQTFSYQFHGNWPRLIWSAKSLVADSTFEVMEIQIDIPDEMLRNLYQQLKEGNHG